MKTRAGLTGVPFLEGAVLSDPGCLRDTNEDSIGFFYPNEPTALAGKGALVIVADGLGGHQSGEVASAMALQIVREHYYSGASAPLSALQAGLCTANDAIYARAEADRQCAGMGCTCTALVVRGEEAFCVHVGDSRLYALHGDRFTQITVDDTIVHELVTAGVLNEDEARSHPSRHRLSRALGVTPECDYRDWVAPYAIAPGDAFLLCSDGLHDLVTDDEMATAMRTRSCQDAVQGLVALARDRGGHDNISVAVVRMPRVT